MELETCLTSMILLLAMVSNGVVSEGHVPKDERFHKLIERMDDIQQQLAEVTISMGTLDTDIGKMLVQCLDKSDSICLTLDSDAGLQTKGDESPLLDTIKRSATAIPLMAKNRRFYRELFRKRAMVNHLIGVVKGAGNVMKSERKRTCQLNLGFHCETENISDFADIYDFLSSEKSPGKKRSVRGVS